MPDTVAEYLAHQECGVIPARVPGAEYFPGRRAPGNRPGSGRKVSPATISRVLARNGLVTPDPSKRPKSSCIRFEAAMPNECWQSGFTHYPLAGGAGTEILTWLDDHSRYALSLTAHHRVTGPAVPQAFRAACEQHGTPASTLTDNGMVFTTRFSGGKGGRTLDTGTRSGRCGRLTELDDHDGYAVPPPLFAGMPGLVRRGFPGQS